MRGHCKHCGNTLGPAGVRPLIQRALVTSVLVGSLLVAINQGDALLGGHFSASLWWRVPLTYLVPFSVSLQAALRASRG